ncbi:hypothetical protein A1OE_769 [Candidatus Endolissoclinum faulkneri L2]|uniref:Uncharacterized protein n=1 Tax=Candidatus Endolissoclinum faulkneri L2 TaxID=1193729 RepID=K7YR13_9PROT|nr:hypothetical protein A1OE_769 [Candidatus Endolissoclinum faulkneri L2]
MFIVPIRNGFSYLSLRQIIFLILTSDSIIMYSKLQCLKFILLNRNMK